MKMSWVTIDRFCQEETEVNEERPFGEKILIIPDGHWRGEPASRIAPRSQPGR